MGIVSSSGIGVKEFKKNIYEGNISIKPGQPYFLPYFPDVLTGFIDSEDIVLAKKYQINKHYSRNAIFSVIAAKEAVEQSRLNIGETNPPIYMGTATGNMWEQEKNAQKILNQEYKKVDRLLVSKSAHAISLGIAAEFGISNQSLTLSTGCCAGLDSLGLGYNLIKSGAYDVIIAGGCDASMNLTSMVSFMRVNSVSLSNRLEESGRPYNPESRGHVLGEGSAVLIIESEEHALQREANILGEITSYSTNTGSLAIYKAESTGKVMADALKNAVNGEIPDYFSAYALGSRHSDLMEYNALKIAFGDDLDSLPVTGIKAMFGHTLAASGPIQVIAGLLSILHSFIPPTAKAGETDLNLNLVKETKQQPVNSILINTHAVGGSNSCMMVKKYN